MSAWRRKPTRSSCRGRAGTVVPSAEHVGDLITADHKVLSDESESRNNHRYAVVVQDLATQWIQSYPCKTKSSQETQKNLMKFLEPMRKPQVICTDNSLEFGKSCEELSWNHCASTPHRSDTNGIAENSSAESEGRDICGAIAVRSGWLMVGGFYGMLLLSSKHSRSLVQWEDTTWKAVRKTIQRTNPSGLEQWSNITLFLRKTNLDCISLEQKSCQVYFSVMHKTRWESGKETSWSQTLKNWKRWTHPKSTPEGSMQRKC